MLSYDAPVALSNHTISSFYDSAMPYDLWIDKYIRSRYIDKIKDNKIRYDDVLLVVAYTNVRYGTGKYGPR